MHRSHTKAATAGGYSLKRLLAKWPHQKFALHLKPSDICPLSFMEQNATLRKQVSELTSLNKDLNADCDSTLSTLRKTIISKQNISKQKRRLARRLVNKMRGFTRKKLKGKLFHQYSPKQKRRHRVDFKEDSNLFLNAFLSEYGLVPTEVTLFDPNTNLKESLELCPQPGAPSLSSTETLKKCLWAKEKYNISDVAYRELSAILSKNMPRLYQLQKHIQEINEEWQVFPIEKTEPGTENNSITGWQVHVKDLLIERAQKLIETHPHLDHLDVKLSGDGTCVGRSLSLVQMSITILQEGQVCKTCTGNHLVSLFKGPEKYDILSWALEDLRKTITETQSINVPGHSNPISITWFLGGDYKFILASLGLDAATANYACAWCKIHKNDRGDADSVTNYSMVDPNLNARSVTEMLHLTSQPKTSQRYNCSKAPLFPTIPLINVVIDLLHMFLRIAGKLLELLIWECKQADGLKEKHRFTSINRQKWIHMAKLENLIQNICKIPFQWEVTSEGNKLHYKDLRGPELKALFSQIDINQILPNTPRAAKIQKLWVDFYAIINLLHNDEMSAQDIATVKNKIGLWFPLYTELYSQKSVTPYIHIFYCHVVEMLEIHGQISLFTQEGLEKLNDQSTVNFFSATNRKGAQALKQLLLKAKRITYYQDNGYTREHGKRHCSRCGHPGHYKVKCVR